jgi:transcriptional regulator with XRE-family HTH domain
MGEKASERLGAHVTKLRQERNLSIRGLAALAKADATWLSRLERGLYDSPDARTLYRLARALDVDVNELYLEAGFADGHGLPGFTPYLRAKYDLPEDAIAQLEAHFELINQKYHDNKQGDPHG